LSSDVQCIAQCAMYKFSRSVFLLKDFAVVQSNRRTKN